MTRYIVTACGMGRSDDEWAEVEVEAKTVDACFNIKKPKQMWEATEPRWKIIKIVDAVTGLVVWEGQHYRSGNALFH